MKYEDLRCPEEMDLLLPWYVKGTLSPSQMKEVEEHLKTCEVCQKELARIAFEARVVEEGEEGVEVPFSFPELEGGLGKGGVWRRIKDLVASRPGAFFLGVVVEGVLCIVLSLLLIYHPGRHRYVTLSSPQKAQAVVIFQDNLKEKEMRKILLQVGATIVGGPTPQGAYELVFSGSRPHKDIGEVIKILKEKAGVKFVARCDRD